MVLLLLVSMALVALANGQCTGEAEVVIAVPGSNLVNPTEFAVFEDNLIQLLNYWNVGKDSVSVGLIVYGQSPVDVAWPYPFKTRLQVNTRVSLLARRRMYAQELYGRNDVSKAIKMMTRMLTEPAPGYGKATMRPFAKKIGILFQNGYAKQPADVVAILSASFAAKQQGIIMYAVNANGKGPELSFLAEGPCQTFSIDSFSNSLNTVVPQLGNSVCAEMDNTVAVNWYNCLPKTYVPAQSRKVTCQAGDNIIEDPNNCAYYYQCAYDRPVIHSCSDNTIFDTNTNNCNVWENVDCYANVNLTCPEPSGLFAHPLNCGKFMICDQKAPNVMSCPGGTWFEASYKACTFSAKCPPNKIP